MTGAYSFEHVRAYQLFQNISNFSYSKRLAVAFLGYSGQFKILIMKFTDVRR